MLDLKELAEELDDLRDRRDEAAHTCKCGATFDPDDGPTWHTGQRFEDIDEEGAIRLRELESLEDELGDLHVASRSGKGPFIAVDSREWEEYAEQTAYETGMVNEKSTIARYVDWERWAKDLANDYSQVQFDGEWYYYQD